MEFYGNFQHNPLGLGSGDVHSWDWHARVLCVADQMKCVECGRKMELVKETEYQVIYQCPSKNCGLKAEFQKQVEIRVSKGDDAV